MELENNALKKRQKNRNIIIFIILLIIISTIIIIFITNNKNKESYLYQKDDALTIGVNKYLSFLWMIDGAFNNQRYNDDFIVNEKRMSDIDKKFTCEYTDGNKTCIGNNFEEEFKNLFASKISYNKVYGDGQSFYWYEKLNNKYYFTNINTCNSSRMNTKQKIELIDEKDDTMTYKVSFNDSMPSNIYKETRSFVKEFTLIKEDNIWKISKAYYHDPCYMDYYIE